MIAEEEEATDIQRRREQVLWLLWLVLVKNGRRGSLECTRLAAAALRLARKPHERQKKVEQEELLIEGGRRETQMKTEKKSYRKKKKRREDRKRDRKMV